MNNILPFCIYHNYDESTNSYYGYIGNSSLTKSSKFKCPKSRHWDHYGTFYAIDPSLRPIPPGMNLYCIKRNLAFPYNSTRLSIDYDFFFLNEECVYFLTFNSINPSTVPLYLHKLNDNIFPSFDKDPPTSSKFWTQSELSPLYVMTDKSIGIGNIDKLKFKCVNAACIPWVKPIDDIYQFYKDDYLFDNIANCVVYCTEINSHTGINPSNLTNNLEIFEKNKNKVKVYSATKLFDSIKKKSYIYLVISICILFILFLCIKLFLIYRNKNI